MTSNKTLITTIDELNSYMDIKIFVLGGDTLELKAEVINRDSKEVLNFFGIRFIDVDDKAEKVIQSAIFKEIEK